MRAYIFIIFVYFFIISVSTWAQSEMNMATSPGVRGLVIGVSEYEHIQNLQYAHLDALGFSQVLQDAFPNITSKTLINTEATYDSIIIALTSLLVQTNKGDTVIFYFSGHGDCETRLVGEPGFLLTHDTPPHNYLISALRLQELKSIIETLVISKKAEVLLFIDACRAGIAVKEDHFGPGKTVNSLMQLFDRELLFLSCKSDQYSLELSHLEGGVFTHFLVNGMAGQADQEGNNNGYLEAEELRRYLFDHVMKASKGGQTPIATGDPIKVILMCPKDSSNMVYRMQPDSKFNRPGTKDTSKELEVQEIQSFNDSLKSNQYQQGFEKAYQQNNLIKPETESALFFYKKYLQEQNRSSGQVELMKIRLLSAFRQFATTSIKQYLEGEAMNQQIVNNTILYLRAGLEILSTDDFQYSYFRSNVLFFSGLKDSSIGPEAINIAIDSLQLAITIEPYAAYIYNELGNQFFLVEQIDDALTAYEKAQEISPKWMTPGDHIRQIKRNREAVLVYNEKVANTWAVIVGISQYAHMPSFRYADDDAYQLYKFLRDSKSLALPDEQIKLIIDETATKDQIEKALLEVSNRAEKDDLIIFYFSGHANDYGYLASDYNGYDGRLEYKTISKILESSKTNNKLVLSDACHSSNNFYSKELRTFKKQYQAFETEREPFPVIFSDKGKEYSLEDGGLRSGIFSHLLVKALAGEADLDHDSIITIAELFEYTQSKTRFITNGTQIPQVHGNSSPGMPVVVLRKK